MTCLWVVLVGIVVVGCEAVQGFKSEGGSEAIGMDKRLEIENHLYGYLQCTRFQRMVTEPTRTILMSLDPTRTCLTDVIKLIIGRIQLSTQRFPDGVGQILR
jgi:hypothetical protein